MSDEQENSPPEWLVVCVDRTRLCDHLVFWAPERRGYTTDLNKAGRYDDVTSQRLCFVLPTLGVKHLRFKLSDLQQSIATETVVSRQGFGFFDRLYTANESGILTQ